MAKIGRNDPCPCGSGKKYKKCCWPMDDSVVGDRLAEAQERLEAAHRERDDLRDQLKDAMSERVLLLIETGRFEDAETACHELRDRFPDDPIGIERLARLTEARGDFDGAASLYRQAVKMIDNDRQGYFCGHCRADIVKAIRRLQPDRPSPPLGPDSI